MRDRFRNIEDKGRRGFIFGLLGWGIAGFATYQCRYDLLAWATSKYNDFKQDSGSDSDVDLSTIIATEEKNYLILGEEKVNGGQNGRADAIIVLNSNPNYNRLNFISIPRDIPVNINGIDSTKKINSGLFHGGIDLQIKLIEDFIEEPIEGYIKANFESFKDSFSALKRFFPNMQYTPSEEDLTDLHQKRIGIGDIADPENLLKHLRYRDYPLSAVGRSQKHARFMQGMTKTALSMLNQFPDKLVYESIRTVFGILDTNISSSELMGLYNAYSKEATLASFFIPGKPNDYKKENTQSLWIPVEKPQEFKSSYLNYIMTQYREIGSCIGIVPLI